MRAPTNRDRFSFDLLRRQMFNPGAYVHRACKLKKRISRYEGFAMARFLNFFPRQMMMGDASASGTIYSDIYDVREVANVTTELRLYTSSGAGAVSVQLEQSDDPTLSTAGWSNYGTALTKTGGGLVIGTVGTVPGRFLRAKIQAAAGSYVLMHFTARGFC